MRLQVRNAAPRLGLIDEGHHSHAPQQTAIGGRAGSDRSMAQMAMGGGVRSLPTHPLVVVGVAVLHLLLCRVAVWC